VKGPLRPPNAVIRTQKRVGVESGRKTTLREEVRGLQPCVRKREKNIGWAAGEKKLWSGSTRLCFLNGQLLVNWECIHSLTRMN